MVNEDIITSLRNAINNGEQLEEAIKIMVNSGYNLKEVQEASKFVGNGIIQMIEPKSDEELAEDSSNNGTHKLIPIKARHGPCLQFGDYINCYLKGQFSQIIEGKTRLSLGSNNGSFETDNGTDIPF